MAGIFPDPANGGRVVRDIDGNCLSPVGVSNAYCPPATFESTCDITALPGDCSARISAAQVNAIVSELLCLAVSMNPNGTWNCAGTCNLSSAFNAWVSDKGIADELTIVGTGTVADPYRIAPEGLVAALCADAPARQALSTCLISGDANNTLAVGTDGRLRAPWQPEGYSNAPTPPASPLVGDRWYNSGVSTTAGVGPGVTGTWNGTAWDANDGAEGFTKAAAPPANPKVGDYWQDTADNVPRRWDGTNWRSPFAPFAHNSSGAVNQALAQNVWSTVVLGVNPVVVEPNGSPALGSWTGNRFTFNCAANVAVSSHAIVSMFGNTLSNGFASTRILLNGATAFTMTAGSAGQPSDIYNAVVLGGGATRILSVSAGDYIELQAYASITANLNPHTITNSLGAAQLSIVRVS